jgi:hypothetical protein
MKSWKLLMLCSALSLAACQDSHQPTRWSDIQGKPEGFNDDQDDVRGDEDVRAIARGVRIVLTPFPAPGAHCSRRTSSPRWVSTA